jgi:ABC-type nitrate/sulfonate/bicarbonate transport system substrate-binding protein
VGGRRVERTDLDRSRERSDEEAGVNAEIIRVSASTMALQAMLAGELDVIVTSVTTLVTSRLAGADVVMILAIVPTFLAHIVTSKSVTDVKQLKGKVGGVGRPGTTTEIGMHLALGRLGIDPNVDVKLIPVGNTADALAALSKVWCNSAFWWSRSSAKRKSLATSRLSTSAC